MPRFESLADEAKTLLASSAAAELPSEVRAFLYRVSSCGQDMKRYQWIRCQFGIKDFGNDGTYRPIWPISLPRAESLDQSIDLAMRTQNNE
jgi:hypothetical protein